MVGQHGGQVAVVDGDGPAFDELADLLFVGHGWFLLVDALYGWNPGRRRNSSRRRRQPCKMG